MRKKWYMCWLIYNLPFFVHMGRHVWKWKLDVSHWHFWQGCSYCLVLNWTNVIDIKLQVKLEPICQECMFYEQNITNIYWSHTHTCTHTYTHINIHTYMHSDIHTYIHTYTYLVWWLSGLRCWYQLLGHFWCDPN